MDPASLSLSHIKAGDYTFAYRKTSISPDNPPLLLVHGHISDLRCWTALETHLSAHFTIYNISRRFAWPNTPIPASHTPLWEQDAEDVIALISALEISPCHALGNSSGAFVLAWAAKTHPHLFRTLLLEEPPIITLFYPSLPPTPLAALKFFLTHPISFFPVSYYGATTIGPAITSAQNHDDPDRTLAIFGPGVLGPRFWKLATAADGPDSRKQQMKDNAAWLHNFFRSGAMPVIEPQEAREIRVPTLVLTGTEGPWSQRCVDAELFRVLGAGRKERVWVKGAGHLMHEDQPEGVAEAVRAFVGLGNWGGGGGSSGMGEVL